jgi:hypothetical protein
MAENQEGPTKDAPGPAPTTDEVVDQQQSPVQPTEGGAPGDISTKGFEGEPHE